MNKVLILIKFVGYLAFSYLAFTFMDSITGANVMDKPITPYILLVLSMIFSFTGASIETLDDDEPY